MTYPEYEGLFEPIINGKKLTKAYEDEAFVEYTVLNQRRHKRWNKTGKLTESVSKFIKAWTSPLQIIVITEHWCGDSAHALPFIQKMVELNDQWTLDIQLRDLDSEIDAYLTNGSKSIPKVVFRDGNGNDLATWGPRPNGATELRERLLETVEDVTERKTQLQQWYNSDKGVQIQDELIAVL